MQKKSKILSMILILSLSNYCDKQDEDISSATEEETTGIQGISEAMFVHPLIKAIQELSAKVEELEKKLEYK